MQEEEPSDHEFPNVGPFHGDELPIEDMNAESAHQENDGEDCESECEHTDDPVVDLPNAESPGPQSVVAETMIDTSPDVLITHEVPDETPMEAFEDGQGWWNTASPGPSPAPATAGNGMPSSNDPSTFETLPYKPG